MKPVNTLCGVVSLWW